MLVSAHVLLSIVFIWICLVFGPAGPALAGSPESLEILATHFPPYDIENPKNGLKGFDVEIVEQALRLSGRSAHTVFLPWKRAVKLVQEGKAFGVISCSMSEDRKQHFIYSDPVSFATTGFFAREHYRGPAITQYKQIGTRKVGTVSGYNTEKILKTHGITTVSSRSDTLAMNVFIAGRTDFLFNIKEFMDYARKEQNISEQFHFFKISERPLFLCISKKWPNAQLLRNDFNSGMRKLREDGTYQAVHSKYQ